MKREKLQDEILRQYECDELLVLSEYTAFSELPEYGPSAFDHSQDLYPLEELAEKTKPHLLVALFVAAALYPDSFDLGKLLSLPEKRFTAVKRMGAKGKANAVTAWLMTKPQMIRRMYGHKYRYCGPVDSKAVQGYLKAFMSDRLEVEYPDKKEIHSVRF